MAGTIVLDPAGKTGAVYRYILFPQILVLIGVIVIEAGAAGADSAVFASLKPFVLLLPHPLKARTLILSVVSAAAFETYFNRITEDKLILPESTVTPDIPPTDEGIVHAYPTALTTRPEVYR